MSTLLTTVDLGNSRCKLCDWWLDGDAGPAQLLRRGAIDPSSEPIWVWPSAWLAGERHGFARKYVALSSVAGVELEQTMSRVLAHQLGGEFVGSPSPGLDNRCRAPELVGRDRLFAARGAFEIVGDSALIIDIGTAMTVDALAVERDGTRPAFLGGAIAPGPRLLAEALARGTARLPLAEPRMGVRALGEDTEGAMLAGIFHGVRGAARELLERIASETGLVHAPIMLTGGARAFLAEPPLFGERDVETVEDLVHIGLLCAALAEIAGTSSSTRRYGWWSKSA